LVDERQEPVETVGGQLAERDFRPQTGQVLLPVEPRDAEIMQARMTASRRPCIKRWVTVSAPGRPPLVVSESEEMRASVSRRTT
jgi:hypothetical protein